MLCYDVYILKKSLGKLCSKYIRAIFNYILVYVYYICVCVYLCVIGDIEGV